MFLQTVFLRSQNHSVELLLLISIPTFLDDNLHGKVLDELESEALESITLSHDLHRCKQIISLFIRIVKFNESILSMLNLGE